MLINFKIIFLFVSLIYFSSGFKINKNICRHRNEIDLSISKIKNSLNLLKKDPANLLPDVVLGLSFTKSNLLWSINKLQKINNTEIHNIITNLKDLINLCEVITKEYYALFKRDDVTAEGIWVGTINDIKFNELQGIVPIPVVPDGTNCEEVEAYLLTGSPYYSDYCISGLFNEFCHVTEDCWDAETNLNFHSGYKTTHRLFYLQIGVRLQCDKKNPLLFSRAEEIMKQLCLQIYLEAEAIAALNYPVKLRDVFVEQIALCGLEGYAEFAKPAWREAIRSWETELGCYDSGNYYDCRHEKGFVASGTVNQKNLKGGRKKRSDSVLFNGCHTHVIAVTMPALAFHLRYSINECIGEIKS